MEVLKETRSMARKYGERGWTDNPPSSFRPAGFRTTEAPGRAGMLPPRTGAMRVTSLGSAPQDQSGLGRMCWQKFGDDPCSFTLPTRFPQVWQRTRGERTAAPSLGVMQRCNGAPSGSRERTAPSHVQEDSAGMRSRQGRPSWGGCIHFHHTAGCIHFRHTASVFSWLFLALLPNYFAPCAHL